MKNVWGKRSTIVLITVALLLLFSFPLRARWQTHETSFFLIHFQEGLSPLVPQVAQLADEIHIELMNYFQYEKKEKTHLILTDDSDFPGGYADPHLLDQIVINISHPLSREFGTRYENWLRLVLAHEYGHILHLNLREGTPRGIREALGKIPGVTTPNQYQPWWMLEGYAIMAETLLTAGGRGDDSYYDMILRTAFLEEDIYHFDQIHGQYPLDRWPTGGMSVYIYGASFFQYLVQTYGMEDLVEVSRIFSSRPTGGINTAFYQVYGKNAGDLFLDWKEAKQLQYQRVKEHLVVKGITPITRVTHHGYNTYRPLIHPSGEKIIYYHTGHFFPGLRAADLMKGRDYPLLKGIFAPTGLSLSRDGESILYARADYQENGHLYLDLYQYHLETDKELRLTVGERARDPVMTPSQDLIYVVSKGGDSRVLIQEAEGGEPRVLLDAEGGFQYSQLALSPSGEMLALIIWRPGGFQDLYLYCLNQEELVAVTDNRITVDAPSWSPDGDYILFCADRGGIYNLYAYQLEERRFYQITNLLTGAFDPVVHPSTQQLFFVGYSQEGFDLYQMPYGPGDWKPVLFPIEAEMSFPIPEEVSRDLLLTSYNPIHYLTPRYVVPNFYLSTQGNYLGLVTGGRDPLDMIQYNLSLEYEGDRYIYYRWGMRLQGQRLILDQESSREPGRFDQNYRDSHRLQLTYPLSQSLFHITRLGGGIVYRNWLFHNQDQGEDYRGFLFLNRGSVRGWDTLTQNRDLLLQYNLDFSQGQYYSSGILDLRETFSFSSKESLSLRGAVGLGERQNTFSMGGLYGYFPIRGFDAHLSGDGLYYFHGEYREVISSFKRGQGLNPIFFDTLSLAFFAEGGGIRKGDDQHFIVGYGGELSLRMELFYGLMPLRFHLGLAANNQEEGSRFYFSFQLPY